MNENERKTIKSAVKHGAVKANPIPEIISQANRCLVRANMLLASNELPSLNELQRDVTTLKQYLYNNFPKELGEYGRLEFHINQAYIALRKALGTRDKRDATEALQEVVSNMKQLIDKAKRVKL